MPTITHKRRKRQYQRVITRTVDNSDIYNSSAWRKARRAHLLDPTNALCVKCLELGRYEVATVLDHIVPITQGGAVWDRENWQPLCTTHHNQKSGREAHSHITKGK
jgi:5-methylcytosine-specific restriction endonuclease McrA